MQPFKGLFLVDGSLWINVLRCILEADLCEKESHDLESLSTDQWDSLEKRLDLQFLVGYDIHLSFLVLGREELAAYHRRSTTVWWTENKLWEKADLNMITRSATS